MSFRIRIRLNNSAAALAEDIADNNKQKAAAKPRASVTGKQADKLALARISSADRDMPGVATLLRYGYIPLIKGNYDWDSKEYVNNPLIGSGAQGQVFEVVRNGKRYAAKVVNMDDGVEAQREWIIRNKIHEIHASLPREVARHIIDSVNIKVDHESENSGVLLIYIMELLRPLNETEAGVLFYGDISARPGPVILRKLTNASLLYKAIKHSIDNIPEWDIDGLNTSIAQILEIDNYNIQQQLLVFARDDMKIINEKITAYIRERNTKNIKYFIESTANLISFIIASHARDEIASKTPYQNKNTENNTRAVQKYIQSLLQKLLQYSIKKIVFHDQTQFDADYESDAEIEITSTASAEVRSFITAMQYLANHYKIYWGDLHKHNVMIRPSTGDYVATDIGFFSTSETENPISSDEWELALKEGLKENMHNKINKIRVVLRENCSKTNTLLSEIKIDDAIATLDSKATRKIVYQYGLRSDHVESYDNDDDPTDIYLRYLKNTIKNAVPRDLLESQKALTVLWLRKLFLSSYGTFSKYVFSQWVPPEMSQLIERYFQYHRFVEPQYRDIMNIEDFSTLSEVVEAAWESYKKDQEKRAYVDADKGTEHIGTITSVGYPPVDVYIAHNKGAACELGKGTSWCTAAPGANWFAKYYKQDDPLFIFINKNTPDEKMQFHYGSAQFMDKNDRPVHKSTSDHFTMQLLKIPGIAESYPIIIKFAETYGLI